MDRGEDEACEAMVNGDVKENEEKKEVQMTPFYEYVFQEYSLMAELLLLQQQSLAGIYILPSSLSSLIWNGAMFVRQGSYQGGHFRFKLLISDRFPDDGPVSVVFTPPVFHPLIHPSSGELHVHRAFHPWKKKVHHLWNVVAYIKRCFITIDTTDPLNKEAADVFQNDPVLFKVKVKESMDKCMKEFLLHSDPSDGCSFRFTELDESSSANAKKEITNIKDSKLESPCILKRETDIRSLGLSWMSTRLK